jgi:hypothetical protein
VTRAFSTLAGGAASHSSPKDRHWPWQRSRGRPPPPPHHCRPRRRSRRRPPQRRGGSWSRSFPSPAAAAAHAAAVVAADILVLPNSIPTATALISDRLWNYHLDIFQRVQLMWLAAAASGVRAVAQHRARSRSPSLVLRWSGGRLLCLRLLPPRVHRRDQVRPRALEPHAIARVCGCLCRSADNPHVCACVSVFCCRSQEPQGR